VNRRRRNRGAALIACAVLLAGACQADAWDRHVHYELTLWLAKKAGFKDADVAAAVARGAQSLDDSAQTSAVALMVWVMLTGDQVAAGVIRKHHFPSDSQLPAPPEGRVVVANSSAARYEIDNAARATDAFDAAFRFGQAVHPLQDSWSHAGEPDIPLRPFPQIRRTMGFGHPRTRGGWRHHFADLAHEHACEVQEVAEVTYVYLLKFLKNNPSYKGSSPASWKSLETAVLEFANAKDKKAREAWSAKYDQPPAAPGPVGPSPPPSGPEPERGGPWLLDPPGRPNWNEPPRELVEQAQAFVRAWIGERNIAAAAQFVDNARLASELQKLEEPLSGGQLTGTDAFSWTKRFLTSYLIADHAAVDAAGHLDISAPDYKSLPESVESARGDFATSRESSWRAPTISTNSFVGIQRYEASEANLVTSTGDEGTQARVYAIALQFPDQPFDAVVVIWGLRDGRWIIERLFGVIA